MRFYNLEKIIVKLFIWFFFEELSYEETAKVLRKNKKQIDNLVYRAKGALKKILTKEGSYFEK